MLYLASQSPRRQELLARLPFPFVVRSPVFDEEQWKRDMYAENPDIKAEDFVARLALGKALALANELAQEDGLKDRFVLAADTVVVLEEKILDKGRDSEQSAAMLHLLAGQTHRVMTAVVLLKDGAVLEEFTKISEVSMAEADPVLIRRYVATGSPFDKAGAYGIQDMGGLLIERISGDYYNIVGLPLRDVYIMLGKYLSANV